MLRILYVNTPSYCGGSEVSLLTVIKHLAKKSIDATLVTTEEGALSAAGARLNVPVRIQAFPWLSRRYPWPYVNSIAGLAAYIRSSHCDLIHTNCDHSLSYVMAASRLTGVPYVSHVRDMVRAWFQPKSRLRGLQGARSIIVASHAMLDYCLANGLSPAKLRVIYNPVELSSFAEDRRVSRAALRANWGIPNGTIVVAIIGHIQQHKGHQEFVDAALGLLEQQNSDQHNNIHFVIVGCAVDANGAALEASLRYQIARSSHGAHIHFVGHHTDMPDVYSAVDIVASPSWNEPFGRVAVEAMASGCAVVATDNGGHRETIQNNVSGLLIPPRSSRYLAEAIAHLAGQSAYRQTLADRGRLSSTRFAAQERANDILQLYHEVLNR